jgi:hypothetical protein
MKRHAMKTYEGVDAQIHSSLLSAQDGRKWSASRRTALLSGEGPPEEDGSWSGHSREQFLSLQISNPEWLGMLPKASHYTHLYGSRFRLNGEE